MKSRVFRIINWIRGHIDQMSFVQKLFASLFTVAGLIFVFAVPPFQNPDEPMHFYRSYQVATGHVFSTSNESQLYGGEIPLSMRELVIESEIEHSYEYEHRFFLNYDALMRYEYDGEKVFEGFPNTAIYSPLAYIPSALAHGIVMLFDGPLLAALYLGRILSLLATLAVFLCVMRIIPFGKWMIFTIGLLPMTVASAVSISADAMTLSLSLLMIAVTLFITFHKKVVSKWWFILLISLMVSVSLVKQAHLALLPIVLLIPLLNKKYRERKFYIMFGAAFLASFALFFVWFKKTDQIVINFTPSIQPDLQKLHVLQHPIDFIGAILTTYLTNYGNGTVISMFGNFGWLTATLPTLFIIMSALMLYFGVQARDKGEVNLTTLLSRQRMILKVGCGMVFAAVLIMISAALYAYWTPYKEKFIMGVQGRYFLPILPLLLIPFIGGLKPRQRSIKKIIIFGSIAVLISAIYSVFWRFYIIV